VCVSVNYQWKLFPWKTLCRQKRVTAYLRRQWVPVVSLARVPTAVNPDRKKVCVCVCECVCIHDRVSAGTCVGVCVCMCLRTFVCVNTSFVYVSVCVPNCVCKCVCTVLCECSNAF